MDKYQRLPYFGTLKETGRQEDRKKLEKIGNQGSG